MERVLGAAHSKPAELAHVDMGARLKAAGLVHFIDYPQFWPPTMAVCCSVCRAVISQFAFGLAQVRELASKVKTMKKNGERKPFVAADLKKCVVAFGSACVAACTI